MLAMVAALSLSALNSPAQEKVSDDISKLDFAALRQRADNGDASAQTEAGVRYSAGTGGASKDYAQAAQYFQKAAEQGYPLAQTQLGFLFQFGLGVQQSYAQSRLWFQKALDQGGANANRFIAELDREEQADFSKLNLAYLQQLASAGVAAAQDALGSRYRDSSGGAGRDYAQALVWYRKSADQAYAHAENNLGTMYWGGKGVPQDYAQAAIWFRKAAEHGLAPAQVNLGSLYADGQGVTQDYAQAEAWYRKAAEQGDARAQNNLGNAYSLGQGEARDYAQAALWYRKAAEQGLAPAQNSLGYAYSVGQGLAKDYAQAATWTQKAADQGYAAAQKNMGNLYRLGYGVAQDQAQAAIWYRKAADQGFAPAQNQLALLYQNGQGVTQDSAQAEAWYRKAADQGYQPAKDGLQAIQAARVAQARQVQPAGESQDVEAQQAELQAKREQIEQLRQDLAQARGEAEDAEQQAASYKADADLQARSRNTGVALGALLSTVGQNHFESDARKARRRMSDLEQQIAQLGGEVSAEETQIARAVAAPHVDTAREVAQDGNAIQATANQQIAAIRAIGDANAAAQRQAAQQRLAAQRAAQRQSGAGAQGTGDKFNCVGASGADSGYNNGCQRVSGANSGIPASPVSSSAGNYAAGIAGTGGGSTSSANGSKAGSAGTGARYAAPLAASCIGQFWDPKFYNWLSFQNNCGQDIHLSFIAKNPTDTFGMSAADLAGGKSTNTGRSQSEVNQKGGFNLYVCPAGYIPVDATTHEYVGRPNQTFTCKQQ
jgi:TPR repeat protein